MPRKKGAEYRHALREELWPGSAAEIWQVSKEKGFWPAPRPLPLILSLIDRLVGKGKEASLVYLDLLSRDFGQGVLELRGDEAEYAYCAGFDSKRAKRSWKERVRALAELGFIRVKNKGPREIAFILMRHPYLVLKELRAAGKIDDAWWQMVRDQVRNVGGAWPDESGLRLLPGAADVAPESQRREA